MKNKTDKVNKVDTKSPDLRQEMLDKLKKLYPPLFDNEGMLNQDELQALVNDFSTPQTEKYEFNWAGKQQSKKKAFTRSKATLRGDAKRSVDFDKTENLIIEGDNLEVLKLLQKSYFGKIKCIYIDPPYNTGNDFIYSDDYSEDKKAYWEKSGVKQNGVKLDTNTDSSGRYHSNWLSMMYPRLLLARNLLKEDGVIFVSIGEIELANLRKAMDEIFGESNFLSIITRIAKKASDKGTHFAPSTDYILSYANDITNLDFFSDEVDVSLYTKEDSKGKYRDDVALYQSGLIGDRPNCRYYIECPDNSKVIPPEKKFWRWSETALKKNKDLLVFKKTTTSPLLNEKGKQAKWNIYTKSYLNERQEKGVRPRNYLDEFINRKGADHLKKLGIPFDYSKPVELIEWLLKISQIEPNDIVLDFFAGSGTTAEAVMRINKNEEDNRNYILVQIPEATDEKSEAYKAGYKTISDICIERVKRAGKKLKEGAKDLDVGFKVFKLATSHFPENTFAPDPDKSDEENKKALEVYIKKATSQKGLFKDGVVDLVYEIALKDGFELTLKMDKVKGFDKNTVYKVSDNHKEALICVDDNLNQTTIDQLESHKDQRFICLHTSVNTTKKWNLQNILGSNLWLV